MDAFMNFLTAIVDTISSFLWDYALMYLLVATGIYFTIRLGFIQLRKFGAGLKAMFGGFSLHGKSEKTDSALSRR